MTYLEQLQTSMNAEIEAARAAIETDDIDALRNCVIAAHRLQQKINAIADAAENAETYTELARDHHAGGVMTDEDDTEATPVEDLVTILADLTCTLIEIGPAPGRDAMITGAINAAARDFIASLDRATPARVAFLITEADDLREGDDTPEYHEAVSRFTRAANALLTGRE